MQRIEKVESSLENMDLSEGLKMTKPTLLSERYLSPPRQENKNFYSHYITRKSKIPGMGEYNSGVARDYAGPQSPKS